MRNFSNIARQVGSFDRSTDQNSHDVNSVTQKTQGQRAKTAEKIPGTMARPFRKNAAIIKSLKRNEANNETVFSAQTLTQGNVFQNSYQLNSETPMMMAAGRNHQ